MCAMKYIILFLQLVELSGTFSLMVLNPFPSAFVTNSLMNPVWMVKTRMQLEMKYVNIFSFQCSYSFAM